jgi:Tol biopolymer transport system component
MKKYSIPKKSLILIAVLIFLPLIFASSTAQNGYDLFQKALAKERGEGNLEEAIALYQKVVKEASDESLAANAQLRIGICYEKLGIKKVKQAQKAFQKVIDTYPGQTETVKMAKEKLTVLLRAQPVAKKGDNELKMTKIPIDSEKVAYGFISPDEKKLAYVSGEGDIWVREIATGNDVRLIQTPIFDYWCFWSPDSEIIAYLDVLNGLHVVSVKGGEPKTLIEADSEFRKAGNYAWPVGWTPDHKMIICCTLPLKSLSAIPISGGEWKNIFKFSDPKQAEEVSLMVISPNNKLVAYQSKKSGNDYIYIIPVEGGEPIQITHHAAADTMLSWSFDGKWLAFESKRSGTKEIWVIKIAPDGKPESKAIRVVQGSTDPGVSGTLYSWTKDGKIGIYLSRVFSNIFIVDLESKKESQLTNILGREDQPRWSADGKEIAFISDRGEKRNIWIMPSNGGEEKLITGNIRSQGFIYISSPTWSPDGKHIAFISSDWAKYQEGKEYEEICVVDVQEDEEPHVIAENLKSRAIGLSWSPDGNNIIFSTWAKDKCQIHRVPSKGGEIQNLNIEGLFPDYSPDGKKIVFSRRVGGLKEFWLVENFLPVDKQQSKGGQK